jgi:U3 small nucleolar RNA-associated protein 16
LKNQAKKRKHIEAEEEETKVEDIETEESTSKTQKFDRHNLPDFLPEEFLQDEVKDDIEIESDDEAPRKNKKTKIFLEEKKPKDKKKGSTTYRVAEAKQDRLAPKLSKNAQAMKESLMGSRKGQVRKNIFSGFLRK